MKKTLSGLMFWAVLTLSGTYLACAQEAPSNDEGIYGAGIMNDQYLDLDGVIHALSGKDTVHTTLKATVSEVCQVKGCWMTLGGGNDGGEEMLVRFKDYGFFVPKDLGGRNVLVEGKAYRSITSVEELRHYAEDAGKSKEEIMQITEPESTLSFEATGVKVLDN